MATCSESKHKSTAVQWASFYRQAYLGNSSYHTNQHPPPPWPGDDVCKESNGQSLGSVFWTPWTSWRIGGFSRPNEGIRPSFGLAMIYGEKPGNRLQQLSIDSPASARWTATGEDSRSRLDKSSAGTRWGNQNGEPSPGIQLLGATAFDHLWASEDVVEAFAIWLGECQGLLRAWLEGITECERNPRMLNVQAGAAAVVAAEE